jgi:hypothetical protein
VIEKSAVIVRLHKYHLSNRSGAVPNNFISVDFLRGVAGDARALVVNNFLKKVLRCDCEFLKSITNAHPPQTSATPPGRLR